MKQKRFKFQQKQIGNEDEHIYIELDIKCSCPQSKLNNCSSIQFSRRYLQCQSSMPVAFLRSYIQQILPHSSMTQVSLFDPNNQLLNDSQLLRSLTTSTRPTNDIHHIPIRFTFSHCTCSSPKVDNNSIVNLLTPPSSCHSSFLIENLVESNQSIIDEITAKFGEICPPLPSSSRKKTRNRLSSNMPLDLSLKKRSLPSSFDIYSSQAKWIKT